MATPSQIAANRENSAHSTGPKTAAGKSVSATNNFRHGLASGQLIIVGECRDAYDALESDLLKDRKPADDIETLLVKEMARHYWLIQRALRLEAKAFDGADGIPKDLAIILRYRSASERAFHQTLAALTKLQNQRKKDEIGFESQKRFLGAEMDTVNRERVVKFLHLVPGEPGFPSVEPLEYTSNGENAAGAGIAQRLGIVTSRLPRPPPRSHK